MEDRYLYRAKRTDNGEWVEGSLMMDIHKNVETNEESEIFGIYPNGRDYVKVVDQSTICQCTGLKDKNGKLIFENDILMCHGNKKDLCKVCFGEFKVLDIENMVDVDIVQGWYYKPLETDGLSKCEPFCHEMPLTNYYLERMEAEVVSNIFDNPELLEVGE